MGHGLIHFGTRPSTCSATIEPINMAHGTDFSLSHSVHHLQLLDGKPFISIKPFQILSVKYLYVWRGIGLFWKHKSLAHKENDQSESFHSSTNSPCLTMVIGIGNTLAKCCSLKHNVALMMTVAAVLVAMVRWILCGHSIPLPCTHHFWLPASFPNDLVCRKLAVKIANDDPVTTGPKNSITVSWLPRVCSHVTVRTLWQPQPQDPVVSNPCSVPL